MSQLNWQQTLLLLLLVQAMQYENNTTYIFNFFRNNLHIQLAFFLLMGAWQVNGVSVTRIYAKIL